MERVFELEAQLEGLRIRVAEVEQERKFWEDKFVSLEMKRSACCESNEDAVRKYKEAFDIVLQEAHYTLHDDRAFRLLEAIDEAAAIVKGK